MRSKDGVPGPEVIVIPVSTQVHIEQARRDARELAQALGFDRDSIGALAIAVSELASNLLRYAERGEIRISPVEGPRGQGVRVESLDQGPGIRDLELAMKDGHSTGGGLGSGLPAARRLMDDFDLTTGSSGTRIVASKWKNIR